MLPAIFAAIAAFHDPRAALVEAAKWERIDGVDLKEHLQGALMHDPECSAYLDCDQVFLRGGSFRRRISAFGWEKGTYTVKAGNYCVHLSSGVRCFELWRSATLPYLRVPVNARRSAGTIVHLIPASRADIGDVR